MARLYIQSLKKERWYIRDISIISHIDYKGSRQNFKKKDICSSLLAWSLDDAMPDWFYSV
jgi:hypothetical protein